MAAPQPYDIIAFAVYSADDNSLTFYKNYDSSSILPGMVYNDKTATAIYTGIENTNYTVTTDQAWNAYNTVITSVSFVDEISPTSTAFWFSGFTNLTRVNNPENLDTSNVTSMRQMFANCSSLTYLNIASFNTGNVTDMGLMFYGCTALASLNISNWDINNVTTIQAMFYRCLALKSLDLSGWNTSNITNMRTVFEHCENITTITFGTQWNTSKVTDFTAMFNSCYLLTSLDVSNWDTGEALSLDGMFNHCRALSTINVSNWDTSKVTTMSYVFCGCYAVTALDVSNWCTNNVTDMYGMFNHCRVITGLDLSNWNINKVTNFGCTFQGCYALANFNCFDLSGNNAVTNMQAMFYSCQSLTTLDVSNWNTSKVTMMDYMFYGCSVLTTLDISKWNTSKVTNMDSMFRKCFALTTLDVSNWDVSKVTTMTSMFSGDNYGGTRWKLTSLDVSKWDTSSVTDMSFMFYGQNGLGTIDVSGLDTSKVTTFDHMFAHCKASIIGIENWDTSSATNMNALFHTCMNKSFDVSNFNTSKVTAFTQMFQNCWNATEIKGLENFDTSNGIDFQEMFLNCEKLKYLDLSSFDTSKAVDGVTVSTNGGKSATCLNMLGSAELPLKRLEKLILGEKFRFGGTGATTTNKAKLHTPSSEFVKYADGNWYSENGTAYSPEEVPDEIYGVYYTSPCGVPKKYSIEFGTLKRIANATRKKSNTSEEILTENLPEAILSIKGSVGGTATAAEIFLDKTAYVNGEEITGEFTIDTELNEQDNLLNQIETALTDKVGGDFDAGYQAFYDEFWDNYQENGNKINYNQAFANISWNDITFKPKYDIRPIAASRIFSECGVTDMKKALENAGVILDFSKTAYLTFIIESSNCAITVLPELNFTSTSDLRYLFNNATKVQSIDKIILKSDGSQEFSSSTSFNQMVSLTEIRFEGVIGKTVSLQWSPLSKASIESIISCLSTTSSGQTLSLKKTAVNKAFETSSGANDGSTSAEWNLLINGDGTTTNPGRTNWTITLV